MAIYLREHILKYGYILKDFNTQSFSSWFLIGKNYIFHLENMGFSMKQYTYELTNIIVDVLKYMHLR